MDNIEYFKALKLICLKSVLQPDGEYRIREIFRWYSKTFHTPLHEVGDLPLEDILIAYFESMYENMEEEMLEEHKKMLLESDEQRLKRELEEESEEIQTKKFMAEAEKQQIEKQKKKSKTKLTKETAPVKPSIKAVEEAPPEVKIQFVDNSEDFEAELEKQSIGPGLKKPSEW